VSRTLEQTIKMGEIFFASQEVSAVWLREMYVAIMRCVMGDIFFAALEIIAEWGDVCRDYEV